MKVRSVGVWLGVTMVLGYDYRFFWGEQAGYYLY